MPSPISNPRGLRLQDPPFFRVWLDSLFRLAGRPAAWLASWLAGRLASPRRPGRPLAVSDLSQIPVGSESKSRRFRDTDPNFSRVSESIWKARNRFVLLISSMIPLLIAAHARFASVGAKDPSVRFNSSSEERERKGKQVPPSYEYEAFEALP